MEGEKGINKKSFDGYDYTLLGDIHKHQFLIPDKMAYAGSLIQQNHGETLHNHGFIIWDLKNKKVYFYCRSGNRSGQACLLLETMGFTDVVNVTGGMLAWKEKF